uniref:KIF-binding protein n=1 Tax=Oncorhynchus tshawytscha TaxID=74940 RepID=A0AAZ3SFG1_ONCTS
MKEVGMRLSMYALPQQERIKRSEIILVTLQRQLEFNQFIPLEWAMNAATLSQYYITKTLYMEGRHCLSAAIVIAGLAGEVPSEAAAQRAEIARCWIKYCLNLLQDAKNFSRQFRHLQTICNFYARTIFLVGQAYVNQAKEYFEMDGQVTDHIEILQDHSTLFKALAFFEEDLERHFRSPEGKWPDKLEDEVLRPVLVVKFQVARLHSRLISTSTTIQLENLNRSLECYNFVVQYCKDNPEAKIAIETELELSEEMASLLPLKINRLKAKLASSN